MSLYINISLTTCLNMCRNMPLIKKLKESPNSLNSSNDLKYSKNAISKRLDQ